MNLYRIICIYRNSERFSDDDFGTHEPGYQANGYMQELGDGVVHNTLCLLARIVFHMCTCLHFAGA